MGVNVCVDAVVPGPAPVATISKLCCSLPSRGRDNVAIKVMSCGMSGP
jgi:hypothetical protein